MFKKRMVNEKKLRSLRAMKKGESNVLFNNSTYQLLLKAS